MNRCLNDIFLYCTGEPEPTPNSLQKVIVGYMPDGTSIYGASFRCKQDPKACPKTETLTDQVTRYIGKHSGRTPPKLKISQK